MGTKSAENVSTAVLTVRVPRELKKRLGLLAKARSRNRSRLAVEAIQAYVSDQEELLAKIDQGIRDADAGRLVPHARVKRYLQSWGKKRRLPPPVCR